MKNLFYLLVLSLLLPFQSCERKKLIEVQVPLPEEINTNDKTLKSEDIKADAGTFQMVKLSFPFDSFCPDIDKGVMELNYAKIYLDYTNNLNKLIKNSSLEDDTIEDIINKMDLNNTKLLNNACGYYNHSLFFESLSSKKTEPNDYFLNAVNTDFGSIMGFQTAFKNTAITQFGSGWTWLIVNNDNKLQIINTQNENNPLLPNALVKGKPLLCIDLWEHAFIGKNSYARVNYIDTFISKINWNSVSEKYAKALESKQVSL